MTSTASPRAGHATEPKAPARPASGSRIKATEQTPPAPEGGGQVAREAFDDLLDGLAALLTRHAAAGATTPGGVLWHSLDAVRRGAAAQAADPNARAYLISTNHRDLAEVALGSLECLSEMESASAEITLFLGGDGGEVDEEGARSAHGDLVSALRELARNLVSLSDMLTGTGERSSVATHVRKLAELVALTGPPHLLPYARADLLERAVSAFHSGD